MGEPFGELIEPSPVKFSFDAPGWYVLGFLMILLLLITAFLFYRHYRKNRYRQRALDWLSSFEADCVQQRLYKTLIYETAMLIKRISMTKKGRLAVADKRPDRWIDYLNSTWKEKSFDSDDKELLARDIYCECPVSAERAGAFVEKSKRWIQKHAYAF